MAPAPTYEDCYKRAADLLTDASIPTNAHKTYDLKALAAEWRRLGLALQGKTPNEEEAIS